MEASKPSDSGEQGLPKEGDMVAGKYRVDRVLGQGGMGVVVAAHHATLRQKVAIKFLLPEAAKRPEATERFLREARAAVSIQSEHVARVTDVGTLDTGSPYMVMEYLTGEDLGQLLDARGPLPFDEAVDYILQACEAIAEAHSLGVVHRDLKPANLFLTSRADGSALVKVLDFGLSKATKAESLDISLTAANVIMGSPYYMSPEQIRSLKAVDARSDIWSLGVILYQLITDIRPFDGESLGALFIVIGSDPVPPMRDARPDIPAELETAILKCLEKDPKKRTQSIAELARSLAPFGSEGSRVSVERIHRVLADQALAGSAPKDRISRTGPVPPIGATATPTPSAPVASSAAAVTRASPAVSAATPAPRASAPAVSAITPAPVTPAPAVSAVTPAPSGSVPALSVSGLKSGPVAAPPASAPAVEPSVAAPAQGRRGGVIAIAAIVAAAGIGAGVFFATRPRDQGGDTASPAETTSARAETSSARDTGPEVAPATPASAPPVAEPTPPTADASQTSAASAAPSLFGRIPPKASGSSTAQPAPSASASATAKASASAAASAAPSATAAVTSAPVAPPPATSAPAAPPPTATPAAPPPPPPSSAPAPPPPPKDPGAGPAGN